MLDFAIKHEEKLKLKMLGIMFVEKYKYYNYNTYYDPFELNKTVGWAVYQLVSLDDKGEIIGYISFSLSQDDMHVSSVSIINFTDSSITFGEDVFRAFNNIFSREDILKIKMSVLVGNPIEATYDKLIAQYGGRIVGIYEKDTKCFDGKHYDKKCYEIMRSDFISKRESK